LIDRREKILYAKIYQKYLDGDRKQLKLASLLGYRLLKRAVPVDQILDLHSEVFLDHILSESDSDPLIKKARAFTQLLKKSLGSYSEAYSDTISGLREKSKELEAKTSNLEMAVQGRTGQLERSRTELLQKVEEISEDQGAMLSMIEDLNRINRELTQTREKLKGSEKLAILGKLSMGLSHELRNPLGVIENTANILEKSVGGGEQDMTKWTKRIKEQTRLCSRVIESTLGFSMHDFMESDLVSVENVVLKAVTRCKAEEKVEKSFSANEPIRIKGDEEQLVQAVSSLIMNGLESVSTEKNITLTVDITTAENNGSRLAEICVIDSGEGIEENMIQTIFEPFYSTKTGKIGLGLSLCNAVVKKHKGSMKVQSDKSETRFTITLPLAEGSDNERN